MIAWYTAAGASALALVLGTAYVNCKSDYKALVVQHNAEIAQMADKGALLVAEAKAEALQREIEEKEAILRGQRNALQIASDVASEAQSRPERVRTIIREMDDDACLNAHLPRKLLDGLRD